MPHAISLNTPAYTNGRPCSMRSALPHTDERTFTLLSPSDRFCRLPAVIKKTGLARSTVYLHIKNGKFPAPVKIGPNSVAWLASEVDKWMLNCIFQRNQAA